MRKRLTFFFLCSVFLILNLCACGDEEAKNTTENTSEDTSIEANASDTDASFTDAQLPLFLQEVDTSTPTTATKDGAFLWGVDANGNHYLEGLTDEGKEEAVLIVPEKCIGIKSEKDEEVLKLIDTNETVVSISFLNQNLALTPYLLSNSPSLTYVYLPQNITEIPSGLCCVSSSLTSIDIPQKVTNIGDYAFWLCSSLATVNLNEGLVTIGERAFLGCDSLSNIVIPSTVESIGTRAFSNIKTITFAENSQFKSLGDEAFYDDNSLEQLVFPEGTISIGEKALFGCDKLSVLYLPESISFIGEDAFTSDIEDGSLDEEGNPVSRDLTIYVKTGSYADYYLRGVQNKDWTVIYY